jgi:hypothetical protein
MVNTRSASRASMGPDFIATPSATKSTSSSLTPAARSTPTAKAHGWSHTPTPITLLWLAISVPLVAWDTGYVLGRPHTMEGGALHWPVWSPYKLYGTVDHIYGWKAWDSNNGFTGAQSLLNVVESVMYGWYLWLCVSQGQGEGWTRTVTGRTGGKALLVGFSAALMTLSKTALYCECADTWKQGRASDAG